MYIPSTGSIAPRFVSEPDASYEAALAIDPDTAVVKTIAPGQPGTLGLKKRYGEALVCVRYRESADGSKRYTTVELVVDTRAYRHRKTLQPVAAPAGQRVQSPDHSPAPPAQRSTEYRSAAGIDDCEDLEKP